MNSVLEIRGMRLGAGMPKICVPVTGNDTAAILEEIQMAKEAQADVVEWRVDYFQESEDPDRVRDTLKQVRAALGETPLLFTFRTAAEGGEKEITPEAYERLNTEAAAFGNVDLVDVELFRGEELCKRVIAGAHEYNVKVVVSSHDFQKTPDRETLVQRLRRMREIGGDVPKIATMPNSTQDVLTLLAATDEYKQKYADCPVITMSMNWLGTVSRISGEFFGSALSFGAAKRASAPGQLAVKDLKTVLNILHGDIK